VSLDAALVDPAMHDAIGEAIDDGAALWLGVLPGTDAPVSFRAARAELHRLWRDLGFSAELAARRVVPTPACGLAGASGAYAQRVLTVLRDVGRDLVDPVESAGDDA
jgi:hypothetical protein